MVPAVKPRRGIMLTPGGCGSLERTMNGERPAFFRPRVSTRAILITLIVVFVLLTTDALFRSRGEFDYDLMRTVQRIDFPGAHTLFHFVDALTSQPWAVPVWLIAVVGFFLAKRYLVTLMLFAFPIAGDVNLVLREMIGRSRPHPGVLDPERDPTEVARIWAQNDFVSYPSGHVIGAVLLWGFFFVLAKEIRWTALRWGIQAFSVGVIVTIGIARVWVGSHWVGDVLAGYAFGGAFLVVTLALYRTMEPTTGRVGLIKATPVPHDDSLPHAHALTSTVLFRDGRVFKIYNPGFVPRMLYWGAFQAPFGYAHNRRAAEAAVLRRNLAGLLTEYWFGTNRVAPAIGVEVVDGWQAIVGQYMEGHEPTDHARARAFLHELADRFDEAGLPTWQIDPRQPRSMGNVLEGPDGEYRIIDLESGIVSPLASPRAWWRGIRRAQVPFYDDVYFDVTRAYIEREAAAMVTAKGEPWLDALRAQLDEAEQVANAWHRSEPRIWSRGLHLVWSGFGLRRFPSWVHDETEHGRERADTWLEGAISRWEDERRLTAEEAHKLRESLLDPSVQEMLPHFGVHLLIGVALRFPFGSITRVAYTSGNLALASLRLLLRRISRANWQRQLGIHSPLVILVAAMPGVGTFSYLVSMPVLRHFLLARVTLDMVGEKLPFRVYRRLGMKRIIARTPRTDADSPAAVEGTIAT